METTFAVLGAVSHILVSLAGVVLIIVPSALVIHMRIPGGDRHDPDCHTCRRVDRLLRLL
ncbi:hypothetical protein [Streptomyces sp. NPDC048644]|uniref:hypothetical protein n=1 Tax=Streptomyces sp. NPDC048644 TaxID=3365582 RepID=UPI00370FC465